MHPNLEAVHVLEVGIVLLDPRNDGRVGDAVYFPRHLRDLIPFLDDAHDHWRHLGESGGLRRGGKAATLAGSRGRNGVLADPSGPLSRPPAGVSGSVPDGVARSRWSLAKRPWA